MARDFAAWNFAAIDPMGFFNASARWMNATAAAAGA
jgi:hypothetical protein